MSKVSEILRNQHPFVLTCDSTVRYACECMRERCADAVLVAKEDGELLGIFTDRDAVRRVLAEGKNSDTTTLADVMARRPAAMPEQTGIEVLRQMRDCGYQHLPVVENGRVVGLVSRTDFEDGERDRLEEETALWERIL